MKLEMVDEKSEREREREREKEKQINE